jgi:diacylglycerol O-acyltransferase / wax synthase
VAIFSYDGEINFGVTGDRDTAPDIGVLCRGIEHGVAQLLDDVDTDTRRDVAPSY